MNGIETMILYEDKNIIVCHKKAGIPVQSARIGQQDMVSILSNYLSDGAEKIRMDKIRAERICENKESKKDNFAKEDQKEKRNSSVKEQYGIPELHVVHRLDQPVEGVLVFAKTKRAASELGRQVTDGRMKKKYLAVCCAGDGDVKISDEKITLVDYLVKNGRSNMSFVADKNRKDAKRAELAYRILSKKLIDIEEGGKDGVQNKKEGENGEVQNMESSQAEKTNMCRYILAEIDLKTGRHHQIRVQMSHAGLPLFGDRKYNQCDVSETPSGTQLALCAAELSFIHPVTGKNMSFNVKPQGEAFGMFAL